MAVSFNIDGISQTVTYTTPCTFNSGEVMSEAELKTLVQEVDAARK